MSFWTRELRSDSTFHSRTKAHCLTTKPWCGFILQSSSKEHGVAATWVPRGNAIIYQPQVARHLWQPQVSLVSKYSYEATNVSSLFSMSNLREHDPIFFLEPSPKGGDLCIMHSKMCVIPLLAGRVQNNHFRGLELPNVRRYLHVVLGVGTVVKQRLSRFRAGLQ